MENDANNLHIYNITSILFHITITPKKKYKLLFLSGENMLTDRTLPN